MATTPNYGWNLPDQTTSPPDVVYWLSEGLSVGVDASLKAVDDKAGSRILYGTEASLPGTLEPGQMYAAYEA